MLASVNSMNYDEVGLESQQISSQLCGRLGAKHLGDADRVDVCAIDRVGERHLDDTRVRRLVGVTQRTTPSEASLVLGSRSQSSINGG